MRFPRRCFQNGALLSAAAVSEGSDLDALRLPEGRFRFSMITSLPIHGSDPALCGILTAPAVHAREHNPTELETRLPPATANFAVASHPRRSIRR